jgi:ABC-type bacteriocin/lantibiotic exporter with double-glycine peptidase domain
MAELLSFLLLLQNIQGLEELRFSSVAEQGYDTSCGLSILSDLLTRYWNYPVTEEALLTEWLTLRQAQTQPATDNKLHTEDIYAISFKDMQDLLSSHGFVSKAFRINYTQLVKATSSYAPLILHFADQEGHFVLCLHAEDDFLVIADPAEGVYWLSRDDVILRWQGYALLVQRPGQMKESQALRAAVEETLERRNTLQRLTQLSLGAYR